MLCCATRVTGGVAGPADGAGADARIALRGGGLFSASTIVKSAAAADGRNSTGGGASTGPVRTDA